MTLAWLSELFSFNDLRTVGWLSAFLSFTDLRTVCWFGFLSRKKKASAVDEKSPDKKNTKLKIHGYLFDIGKEWQSRRKEGGGGGGGEEMAKCVRHKTINLFFHMNVNSPRKK